MKTKSSHFIVAAVMGFIIGAFALTHIGTTMWGDSPHNEAGVPFSLDALFRPQCLQAPYSDWILKVCGAFTFMALCVPSAAALASGGPAASRRATVLASILCVAVLFAGHLWLRSVARALGYPQNFIEWEQVQRGYATLIRPVCFTAIAAGFMSLIVGLIFRMSQTDGGNT